MQVSILQVMLDSIVYDSCADVSVKFQARVEGDIPRDILSDELMVGVQTNAASLNCYITLEKSRPYKDFLNKTKDINLL